MQYHKFIVGETVIEFHNNWLGEETVIVNGKVASKDSSFLGMHHHFNVMENGNMVRYVLTTKVTEMMQVALDLRRNGELLYEDVIIRYGSKPKSPKNKFKLSGIVKLHEYDLEEAVEDLKNALDVNPEDPEIHFYLACAFSIMEKTKEGFDSLKNAIKYNLQEPDSILKHEMLAFLRIHPAFEGFLESGYSNYDEKLFT